MVVQLKIQHIQIMGDSKLIIDCFKNQSQPINLFLDPVFGVIVWMLGFFHHVSFQHIYSEKNHEAYLVSKRVL